MKRQIEQTPVDGQQQLSSQIHMRFCRMDRTHMDIRPVRVVGANLQHRQVERPVGLTDRAKTREHSRIPAKKNVVPRSANHKRRPQRFVPIPQTSSGKMTRRRSRDRAIGTEICRLAPVQFCNSLRRDTPGFQILSESKGSNEAGALMFQQNRKLLNGGAIQVIVVIVRQQHGIERGQVSQRQRRRIKALRPEKRGQTTPADPKPDRSGS